MLSSHRCRLERFNENHNKFYYNLQTNAQVRTYLGGIPSNQHIQQSINRIHEDDTAFYWVVSLLDNDEWIGVIILETTDLIGQLELSYEFLPEYWGMGYAYETLIKIVYYAFNSLKSKSLIAITQSKNMQSRKLIEKCGMLLKEKKVMFDEEQSIYHLSKENYLSSSLSV